MAQADRSGLSKDDVVTAILNSVSLKVAVIGALLALVGLVLQDGVVPAFMVIWGTAFFLTGVLVYLVIWFKKPN